MQRTPLQKSLQVAAVVEEKAIGCSRPSSSRHQQLFWAQRWRMLAATGGPAIAEDAGSCYQPKQHHGKHQQVLWAWH